MNGFSYSEVGATKPGGRLPDGYNHLRRRMRVGTGQADFEAAGAAVVEWRLFEGMHVRPRFDRPQADPGARVTLYLGVGRLSFRATCEVVWAVAEPRLKGFGYGTLPGHPERGEESFLVELDDQDAVWLTITAFSVGDAWYTRLAGPLVPVFQNTYALCCGRVLRGILRRVR
jgi:uncharacterized protein (UPF0548 family)